MKEELELLSKELARIRVGIGTSQFHEVSNWVGTLFSVEQKLRALAEDAKSLEEAVVKGRREALVELMEAFGVQEDDPELQGLAAKLREMGSE